MSKKDNLESILEHEKFISSTEKANLFDLHPERLLELEKKSKIAVLENLRNIAKELSRLIPFIRETKSYLVTGITEKSKFSAAFLLFHKIMQSWQALILLGEKGYYYECMELLRSIGESIDLVNAFVLAEDNKSLEDWFSGELIMHSTSRDIFQGSMTNLEVLPEDVQVKAAMVNIYRAYSNYTHAGYAALLELIDPCRKDFDFGKGVGYHRLAEASPNIKGILDKTLFSLTGFYLITAKNVDRFEELRLMWPDSTFTPEQIVDFFKQKK